MQNYLTYIHIRDLNYKNFHRIFFLHVCTFNVIETKNYTKV
jgi:hypothetical protein